MVGDVQVAVIGEAVEEREEPPEFFIAEDTRGEAPEPLECAPAGLLIFDREQAAFRAGLAEK
jgi:hypothetical protein